MAQARDIMTANPVCIRASSDVQEAVEFFLQNQVSSAPVVDEAGHVLGQLPELGLMRAFVKRKVQDTPLKKISDFKEQLQAPQFVNESAELPEVVRGIIASPVHRVLVRNNRGDLRGIISPKDVLRFLNGENRKTGGMVDKLHDLEAQVQVLEKDLQSKTANLERFAKLFESTAYMMHSADKDGKILMANQVLHQNLGYGPKELIGKSLLEIYAPSVHVAVKAALKHIMETGHHELNYSSFISKSGEIFRVEVISSSLSDANGNFLGTFTVSRPVDSEALLRALHGLLEKNPPRT